MKNKKNLCLPRGIGLAHTSRLLVVAKELKKRGYEVVFGSGKNVENIVKDEGFKFHTLPDFPKSEIEETKKLNPTFYSTKLIEKFIRAELALFQKVRPNVVISDLKPATYISCKITNLPHITVNNANATRYYDYKKAGFPIPVFSLSKTLPTIIANQFENRWIKEKLLNRIGPAIVEIALIRDLAKFNKILKKHGQKTVTSMFDLLVGDLTLLCDVPFFRPVKKLPEQVKMIGPLHWQPNISLPSWSNEIIKAQKAGKKIIYLTAGGTGDVEIFKQVLKYLSDFPGVIVATTGNALSSSETNVKQKNIFVTNYLPGDWIASKADVVISFGGNSTVYQTLSSGTPQITLPIHIDQQDNANQIERLDIGVTLNPHKMKKKEFFDTLDQILNNKVFKRKALKYQKLLRKWNGPTNAVDEIEKFFKTNGSISQRS